MKDKLVGYVKYTKWIYRIYFYVYTFLIKILYLFIKTDPNLILFNSFGGKKFDDSPKEIYEAMKNDERFSKYDIVWAFHNPKQFESIKGIKFVKTDTLKYFKTALASRCWITNSSIERGLNFRGKNTFYFNTWHGTPIKKMGTDLSKKNKSFSKKGESNFDVMTAQGDFEIEVFSRAFGISENKFLKCGLPRNDILSKYTSETVADIKQKLGLSNGKKIILYAPTFREYERDSLNNCVLVPKIDLLKWQQHLGEKYCLLLRAHYEVSKIMNIKENEFVKDVSLYPCLNDLMIAADILISDYSSIFFDFSIMDKPMLHYTYDYEMYSEKRGMYFDIREMLSGSCNNEELIEILLNLDYREEVKKTRLFREKYVNYYGNATELSLDCILNNII